MTSDPRPAGRKVLISREALGTLIAVLASRGYQVLGPTARDGAIVYDEIADLNDLPAGWTDRQEPGRYRLERRADQALFGYAVGPHAWKRFTHPPMERLWRARRHESGFTVIPNDDPPSKFAFLGVRACEMHAIAIQDRVFTQGPFVDSAYQQRRHDNFIVALNCGEAAGTCFCVSMKTGPDVPAGFDLALTELITPDRHDFLVETGSPLGGTILADVPHRPASPADIAAAEAVIARTASQMGRTLDTDGLKEVLQANPKHPRWDEVATRCLACANCTMVCPTCFCTTVEDHSSLTGDEAERTRRWDSCFTGDFSYIHGGAVRPGTASRYRQWLTHKLANWVDQFGTSGCVGCGRCIAWCPVGIDITEEAAAIRAPTHRGGGNDHGRS